MLSFLGSMSTLGSNLSSSVQHLWTNVAYIPWMRFYDYDIMIGRSRSDRIPIVDNSLFKTIFAKITSKYMELWARSRNNYMWTVNNTNRVSSSHVLIDAWWSLSIDYSIWLFVDLFSRREIDCCTSFSKNPSCVWARIPRRRRVSRFYGSLVQNPDKINCTNFSWNFFSRGIYTVVEGVHQ